MKNPDLLLLSIKLSIADWFHEKSLSFCGVLALASMLAPLLILEGVHNGVVQRLRESLMRDPSVLVLIPVTGMGAGFDEKFFNELKTAPGLRFGIGRVRSVASEAQMQGPTGKLQVLSLDATAPGDPLLTDHNIPQPQSEPGKLQIALSATAAQHLDAQTGQEITAKLSRRLSTGKFKTIELNFKVIGILPPVAGAANTGFVDLPTLLAIQNFRDGINTPLLQAEGEREPPKEILYESFRAYASTLDDVPVLEEWFEAKGVNVKTRGRDIAAIKKIDTSVTSIIALIAGAGCAGFFAFMASTAKAAARRKWKQLGMLKLIGFSNRAVLVYPMMQALLTGVLGCLLAFAVYGCIAWLIDLLFAQETGGEAICQISWGFLALIFLCVQLLALLASLRSACKAAAISPSTVMREN